MGRFEGRNAIVTGASRGIGANIAHRLAAEGANVAITARTLDEHPDLPGSLNETLDIMNSYGGVHAVIVSDLSDAEDRGKIVAEAAWALGGPASILVNNAAAAIYTPIIGDYPLKRRRLMMEVNFHAPVDLIQAAAPAMLEAGEGWIVNVSSASSNHPPGPPFRTAGLGKTIGIYGATKAALNRVTGALAVELHEHGVRVNTIEPRAAVMSPGAEKRAGSILSDDQKESMEAMVEASIALLDCGPDFTGRICSSLDLLDELGTTVMTLDGSEAFAGGYRPLPAE